ncbi:hypothetical protein L1887_02439 [Cichorium endivia]|nr:hypothetical protein L1887_02439 [Cichorium endivia]
MPQSSSFFHTTNTASESGRHDLGFLVKDLIDRLPPVFKTIRLHFCSSFSGDELLSESFPYKEILNGILWEVEGNVIVQGAVDVNIGANRFAEGGDEDEGVDDQAVKVVDIVDTFRLQEQPPFDKKQFVDY